MYVIYSVLFNMIISRLKNNGKNTHMSTQGIRDFKSSKGYLAIETFMTYFYFTWRYFLFKVFFFLKEISSRN